MEENNQPKPSFSFDVGIIIAKDHEKSNFEATLKVLGLVIEKLHAGAEHQMYLGAFTLKANNGDTLRCVITYMDGQGPAIVPFVQNFMSIVTVTNIITVGVCGGFRDNLTEVIFFDEAWLMDEMPKKRKLSISQYARFGSVDTWRKLGELFQIVKPGDGHVALTFKSIQGTAQETLNKFNEDLPEAEKKTHKAVGCDMEIGYIFNALLQFNPTASVAGKKPVHILHAIKAVSDTGDQSERDEWKPKAMENAARVLIAYLTFLTEERIIHRDASDDKKDTPPKEEEKKPSIGSTSTNIQSFAEAEKYVKEVLADELNDLLQAYANEIFRKTGYGNRWAAIHATYPGREIAILLSDEIMRTAGREDFTKFYWVISQMGQKRSVNTIDASPARLLFRD